MVQNITLQEVEEKKKGYLEQLLMQEKAANTMSAYARHIDTFIRYIREEKESGEFGKMEVVAFKQWLLPKYSLSLIHIWRKGACFCSAFSWVRYTPGAAILRK